VGNAVGVRIGCAVTGESAAGIARAARERGLVIAVAESLTGGMIAAELAAAEGASAWFAGGVVAYSREVKRKVLGVQHEAVVSAEAAEQMATGVLALMNADVAVAVTGAGGPDPQDGRAAGTVFVAISRARGTEVVEHRFDGSPGEICTETAEVALRTLAAEVGA
jgi:nicotinamide-nucleotide amidase